MQMEPKRATIDTHRTSQNNRPTKTETIQLAIKHRIYTSKGENQTRRSHQKINPGDKRATYPQSDKSKKQIQALA